MQMIDPKTTIQERLKEFQSMQLRGILRETLFSGELNLIFSDREKLTT